VMESPFINEQMKKKLTKQRYTLNPVSIKCEIVSLQERLDNIFCSKRAMTAREKRDNLEYILR